MKKILSTVLAIMLVISFTFTGCVGKKATPQPSSATNAAPKPITLNMFVNVTWFWIDSFGGRLVDDEITKRTGVSLNITKAADENQIATLIASGTMPDLIYTFKRADLLTNPNISFTWPELISKYAPDFKLTAYEKSVNTAGDGNVYTIRNAYYTPEEWSDAHTLPGNGLGSIEVRQDLMDEMGLPPIQNLTDFENALIKAKATYPTYTPLNLIMSDIGIKYFYQIFGMPTGATNLYVDNGNVNFTINHPAFKETLQYLNKLYREGLISAEMLTYSPDQSTALFNSGKVFSSAGFTLSADSDNATYKLNNIAGVWTQLPVMLSDKVFYTDDSAGWAGVFITKQCKDPARAIKFVQYMKSDAGSKLTSFGVEGNQYTLDKDGYPVWSDEYKAQRSNLDNVIKTLGIGCWEFVTSGKYDGIVNYSAALPTTLKCLQDWKKVYKFAPWFQQIIPVAGSDESNIYTQLNQLFSDSQIQLIVQKSEADFNTKFDAMMKKANDIGMQAFDKAMTDKYTQVIKAYNQ